jgi:hypothetical protein
MSRHVLSTYCSILQTGLCSAVSFVLRGQVKKERLSAIITLKKKHQLKQCSYLPFNQGFDYGQRYIISLTAA